MSKKGFTLLELLVVIAILGILITILLPALGGIRESGRRIGYNARENLDHFLGQIKMEKRYNKALKMEVISYGNA